MSIRTEKVASVIKRLLTDPIDALAKEHSAGLVTVTSVVLSPDLRIAKVYISIYGNKIPSGKFMTYLDDRKGYIRSIVGSGITLRYTPEIRFYLDDTLEQMQHIQDIIDAVRSDGKEATVNMDEYDSKHLPK